MNGVRRMGTGFFPAKEGVAMTDTDRYSGIEENESLGTVQMNGSSCGGSEKRIVGRRSIMEINRQTLSDFRYDFMKTMMPLEEKYDVMIMLEGITYEKDRIIEGYGYKHA